MKIVTKIGYIHILNYKVFQSVIRFDKVLYYKYRQQKPYSLMIMVNYEHNELVLEFSGKILKEKYVQLINKLTIEDCLQNINKIGFCTLDINSILKYSQVVKCDISLDIIGDINLINSNIRQNLSNYSKWITKNYPNGMALENVVSTARYKKRLVIYNKEKELNQADNVNFINSLENGEFIKNYFKGKVRFELNINTKEQIRQMLNIPSNDLLAVLNSKANPILSVIDEAVKYDLQPKRTQTLRDYERELLLEKCNFNLVKVEAVIRSLINKNTSITRAMQPYKDLINLINNTDKSILDIRELVS